MTAMFPRFALLLMLALVNSAVAADRNGGLQVEILVFAPANVDGSDYWQDSRALPACHAVALRDGSGAEAAFTNNEGCTRKPGMEPAYAGFSGTGGNALPVHAVKLQTAGYTLMANRLWRQGNASLSPVLLRGGRSAANRQELEGTVTLTATSAGTEARLELVLTRMDGDKPQYVTLQETRVIKPGETHYFDHPLFGVLLQVSNVP